MYVVHVGLLLVGEVLHAVEHNADCSLSVYHPLPAVCDGDHDSDSSPDGVWLEPEGPSPAEVAEGREHDWETPRPSIPQCPRRP